MEKEQKKLEKRGGKCMVRCKVCNEEAPVLFDGRCAGCMSVESIEIGKAELEYIYNLIGTPLKDGELMQMFRETAQSNLIQNTKNTSEDGILESKLNYIIRFLVREPEVKLYKTPLKILYTKYKNEIDSGIYKINLLKNYGKTCGGQVVETKMGVVVYKEPEYYDEDEVEDEIDDAEEFEDDEE